MNHRVSSALGWIGVGIILAAYALVSFGAISARDAMYQLLNGVGSILIVIETVSVRNYQPMVLNIIWALIAIFSLAKLFLF